MTVARSILLFLVAAVAEIGGAWLVCQGVYGGVFVAGSLAWGMVVDEPALPASVSANTIPSSPAVASTAPITSTRPPVPFPARDARHGQEGQGEQRDGGGTVRPTPTTSPADR